VKLFKGGHAAFLEQPEAFEAALTDFIGGAA
jgi:pimeloyl-ACP methyl ester carboxylesterase